MKMFILKLLFFSALVALSLGLKYSELSALKDCHQYDSCNANDTYMPFRNCKCDDLCPVYGDCCLNSDYYPEDDSSKHIEDFKCVSIRIAKSVFMKMTCSENWEDAQVESLCQRGTPESNEGQSDLVANLPVTSKDSNITYANYYCAICNNDTKSMQMWDSAWECENAKVEHQNLKDYILSNLVYMNETWGVNVTNNNEDSFISCTVYPVIPDILYNIVRDCTNMIRTCSSNWTDVAVEKTCKSYTSAVKGTDNNTVYRNVHCAMCNYLTSNETFCFIPEVAPRRFIPYSFEFTVLFDFADSSGSNIVGSVSNCEKTEIWDPYFRRCRSVVCPKPNQVYKWNRCVEAGDVNETLSTEPNVTSSPLPTTTEYVKETTNDSIAIVFPTEPNHNNNVIFPDNPLYNSSITTALPPGGSTITGTAVASNVSSEFLQCHKISLSSDEFSFLGNGSIYVQNYSKMYPPEEYQLVQNVVFICTPVAALEKFSPIIAWVSLMGMGVSCICMTLHLVAFILVPDLRNLSGKNLASLCLALLASNITFIVNMFSDPTSVNCLVLAAAMYYFFLASICWMNATAFDIWNTFRLTKQELRITSGNQWLKFIAYSLYSWLLPAAGTAAVVVIDVIRPEGIAKDFLPYLGERWCWFGHRKALLVFFALPMTVLIVFNCVFFVNTARIIAEITLATSNSTTSSHHKNKYKMHMRLAVLMGFTWLTGILAGYLQLEALWYIFVVLNTSQGTFIFVAFTCRRKVWRVMGINSHKALHRGASFIARKIGRPNQNMELKNTSTSSTSVDGF